MTCARIASISKEQFSMFFDDEGVVNVARSASKSSALTLPIKPLKKYVETESLPQISMSLSMDQHRSIFCDRTGFSGLRTSRLNSAAAVLDSLQPLKVNISFNESHPNDILRRENSKGAQSNKRKKSS